MYQTRADEIRLHEHLLAWGYVDAACTAVLTAALEASGERRKLPNYARAWLDTWLHTPPPELRDGEELCPDHPFDGQLVPRRACAPCRTAAAKAAAS